MYYGRKLTMKACRFLESHGPVSSPLTSQKLAKCVTGIGQRHLIPVRLQLRPDSLKKCLHGLPIDSDDIVRRSQDHRHT